MPETDNLDELIKKYSASLMKLYEKREELPAEKSALASVEEKEEAVIPIAETAEEKSEEEPVSDTAGFMATVRTGGGAFPVPDAKIIIRKNDTIVAFLVTDESGDTEKVSLPAFSEKDSLSPETAKTVLYYADVFAEGFEEKRNLTVEASGGAEIILNAELTPAAERME